MTHDSAVGQGGESCLPALSLVDARSDELVLHWFDIDQVPRLIVDRSLAIQWLNVSAERQLMQRRGLARRGDYLVAVNPAHQVQLLALLAGCGDEAETLCLRSEDPDAQLLICVQPLPTERFGLVLRRSGDEFKPRYADFQAVFQLTPGEIRVLLQLADGHSASQVAARLGVSTETVRTHIKNLYAKLGVKSREALLSRIRAFQI